MLGESWVRGKPLLLTVQLSFVSRVKEGLSNGLVWEKEHDTALSFPLCSPVPVSPFYLSITFQTPCILIHCWLLYCCCSVSQSCLTLCTPWTAACRASLSFTIFWRLLRFISTELVMPSNHLILCRPLFLLPSIFPSIRVFSDELALHITWP